MAKDTHITKMIFRKYNDGTIIALFPYEPVDLAGHINSYMHIGQHGGADYEHTIKNTSVPTTKETLNLKYELESIGYNIQVVKRRNYDAYLAEYYKLREKYNEI